ncbi:hypothetical protein C3432_04950 [Citrobacter amalonaticus]|uniref:Uncharacterized protein n=1 Tax=Citrobacter amalonaticus TaxID=35703 RepID=A0A2S4S457_CITAM|nr:hypothetical protein C3432_04950 [Citrobacter amalonaticus]POT78181.1 hypothetical protein C3436_12620 [Citrobacter amalonaticus]POU68633.1 hypothetical protein C3430_06155 [Citrobacter amalonaticus]POV08237.1 hypothetical protein C3424_06170 [Citrobacter amalonaticus]
MSLAEGQPSTVQIRSRRICHELAAFLQREILWRLIIDSNIIFANVSCRRGILAPEFVQCSAPGRAPLTGALLFQPSRGHNV